MIQPWIRTNRLSLSEKIKSCRLLKISVRGRFLKKHSEVRWLRVNYSLIRMIILTLLLMVSNFQQITNRKWEVNWCRQSKMCMVCRTHSKEPNNSSRQLSCPRMAPLTLTIQGLNRLTVSPQWMNHLYLIRDFNRTYQILKETKKRKSVSHGGQVPRIINPWPKAWVLYRTHLIP